VRRRYGDLGPPAGRRDRSSDVLSSEAIGRKVVEKSPSLTG
jgi:hypothetical protein